MRRLSVLPRAFVRGLLALAIALFISSCGALSQVPPHAEVAPSSALIELVKSVPSETDFDHSEVRHAWQVWPQMIAAATATIDLGQFYIANIDQPDSALEPVLRALESARRRGVVVRLLVDESMAGVYAPELARLAAAGVLVRRVDLRPLTGGVMHAKYFIVDGREAFIGSQNFDWRSLSHIHELGVHLRSAPLCQALTALFESDWALAAGQRTSALSAPLATTFALGEGLRVELVYSPPELTAARGWELPAIVDLIAQAQRSIRIELLLYHGPQNSAADAPMARIEAALIAAAARGVSVEILLSDWMLRENNKGSLRGLVKQPGIHVKIVTIPQSAQGDIPFARLIHAKYLAVDKERFWLGSSNWEDRYFLRSRNVGVRVDNAPLCRQLERMFIALWKSPYATDFQP